MSSNQDNIVKFYDSYHNYRLQHSTLSERLKAKQAVFEADNKELIGAERIASNHMKKAEKELRAMVSKIYPTDDVPEIEGLTIAWTTDVDYESHQLVHAIMSHYPTEIGARILIPSPEFINEVKRVTIGEKTEDRALPVLYHALPIRVSPLAQARIKKLAKDGE